MPGVFVVMGLDVIMGSPRCSVRREKAGIGSFPTEGQRAEGTGQRGREGKGRREKGIGREEHPRRRSLSRFPHLHIALPWSLRFSPFLLRPFALGPLPFALARSTSHRRTRALDR